MKKFFWRKLIGASSFVLALLLCTTHSAFAYEKLFTHSHNPLVDHHHHDQPIGHQHHHDDSSSSAHSNASLIVAALGNGLSSGKLIVTSNSPIWVDLTVLTALLSVSIAKYRAPRLARVFKPPILTWLLVSLTLAPNSPPRS